jgi:RNA polymerase sigma factor (sigma-70 family)
VAAVSGRPHVDVEDVLQDTFVRAYQSLDRFACPDHDEDDAFLRWTCGIAKHALGDLMRKAGRTAPAALTTDPPASGATQSRVVRREERFDRLQRALDTLPSAYREALVLARLEGLTAKEIAARMDRTPDAVYQLIARGLDLLRQEFGDTESFHLPDRLLRREGGVDAC